MEYFQIACGAKGPFVLAIESRGEPRHGYGRVLSQPFVLIGRHVQSDVLLADEQVSRKHAFLQVIEGRIFCADLKSRTGVRLRGEKVPWGWLDPGDAIEIGPYEVRSMQGVPDAPGDQRRTAASSGPTVGWPMRHGPPSSLALEVVNGAAGPSLKRMERALTLIGRSGECTLRLSDASVSSFHCALVDTPAGAWMVDLLGRDGILVNGELVRCVRLEDGDDLRIGRFRIRVHVDAPRALSPPPSADALVRPNVEIVSSWNAPNPDLGWAIVEQPGFQADAMGALLMPLVDRIDRMQEQMLEHYHESMLMMFQMFSSMHRDQAVLVSGELEQIRRLTQELHSLHSLQSQSQSQGPIVPTGSGDDHAMAAGWKSPDSGRTPPAPGPQPRPLLDSVITTPEVPSDEDVHALLCQRLAELQSERQGRWQRIISIVTGN
jgi:pSer/pThr/pTyr-binding forkhead associated (FHA) protein